MLIPEEGETREHSNQANVADDNLWSGRRGEREGEGDRHNAHEAQTHGLRWRRQLRSLRDLAPTV